MTISDVPKRLGRFRDKLRLRVQCELRNPMRLTVLLSVRIH